MLQNVRDERLETEQRSQQRSHGYRVMKAKVELLEKYISNPAPRPPGIQANPAADLKIIDEQAEKIVRDKEAFYLSRVEREAEANIRQVITSERRGQAVGRDDHQRGHDEHER